MGFIVPCWKVWEKIDMDLFHMGMDLLHFCHSCLEAYRPGQRYFYICVTLSSKEYAKFSVIHFFSLINNNTCFLQ